MTTFPHLSDDQLVDEILTWSGRLASGEAELLVLIGELDRREAWAGPGLLSCAHWLSWRTGLGRVAAREKVRVARALRVLPLVAGELRAGRLSYSQVRAITRVVTPEDQERWIDVTRASTAGQLERLVRGVRRARTPDEDANDPERAVWRVRATKSYDDDGNAVYRIVLPAEQAAVLDAALEAARTEVERQRAAEATKGSGATKESGAGTAAEAARTAADAGMPQAAADATRGTGAGTQTDLGASAEAGASRRDVDAGDAAPAGARDAAVDVAAVTLDVPELDVPEPAAPVTLADALLQLARTGLEARPPSAVRRTRSALTAQVDPLTGWGRLRDGELLPPSSLGAVLRTLPGRGGMLRLVPLSRQDLTAHDVGRERRLPSLALRELIGTLDGECCRFPGCTRRRKIQAHHVQEWNAGGRTDLANLVLLCSRHHILVHQQGFALVLHDDRRLEVSAADGVAVPRLPVLPWRPASELDPARVITAGTLPRDHVRSGIDLGYAVMVLAQHAA